MKCCTDIHAPSGWILITSTLHLVPPSGKNLFWFLTKYGQNTKDIPVETVELNTVHGTGGLMQRNTGLSDSNVMW